MFNPYGDKVSSPYKTTGKIIVLCILVFRFTHKTFYILSCKRLIHDDDDDYDDDVYR
jgi:hypothetical protein